MKTFRLVSLKILLMSKKKIIERVISLQEGLIINREENDGTWLLEAVITREDRDFFEQCKEKQEKFVMEALITDKNNEPAFLVGEVRETVELSEKTSVMIIAKITSGNEDISNLILKELINDGYTGETLLKEFSKRKEDKREWSKKLAENIYASLHEDS